MMPAHVIILPPLYWRWMRGWRRCSKRQIPLINCLVHSGSSEFISKQNVLCWNWQFYVLFLSPFYSIFACLAFIGGFLTGEMFLPNQQVTLLRVDFGIYFNPAASNISPLFFPDGHSLLEEFCSDFDQF